MGESIHIPPTHKYATVPNTRGARQRVNPASSSGTRPLLIYGPRVDSHHSPWSPGAGGPCVRTARAPSRRSAANLLRPTYRTTGWREALARQNKFGYKRRRVTTSKHGSYAGDGRTLTTFPRMVHHRATGGFQGPFKRHGSDSIQLFSYASSSVRHRRTDESCFEFGFTNGIFNECEKMKTV